MTPPLRTCANCKHSVPNLSLAAFKTLRMGELEIRCCWCDKFRKPTHEVCPKYELRK